jgi:DmsE family decaheme c-type cytochrome
MRGRQIRRVVLHHLLPVGLALLLAGCFKPADTPRPVAQPPAAPSADDYVGAETCQACHEESFNHFASTKMGKLFLKHPRSAQEKNACEVCHGPGKAHAESPGRGEDAKLISFLEHDPTPPEIRNKVCLDCHSKGGRIFWNGSPHASRDVSCTGCHRVMVDNSPKSQLVKATEIETCGVCHIQKTAQTMRSSHMPLREGKMSCLSCHDPHGTISVALLREPSVNDSCYVCHAEKRGPFLWEHAPATESCLNCHDPHGSNHERLLKLAKPRLCQQCHVETRHPTRPFGREPANNLKFVGGKGCVNCHVNIHGSNHPSGFAFTR